MQHYSVVKPNMEIPWIVQQCVELTGEDRSVGGLLVYTATHTAVCSRYRQYQKYTVNLLPANSRSQKKIH
jgi:hypothetical protein